MPAKMLLPLANRNRGEEYISGPVKLPATATNVKVYMLMSQGLADFPDFGCTVSAYGSVDGNDFGAINNSAIQVGNTEVVVGSWTIDGVPQEGFPTSVGAEFDFDSQGTNNINLSEVRIPQDGYTGIAGNWIKAVITPGGTGSGQVFVGCAAEPFDAEGNSLAWPPQ